MALESVARRYARAVFELALEHGDPVDAWLADLRAVERALAEPDVQAVLVAPQVPFDQKRQLIERGLGGLPEQRRNLLYMLIESRRLEALGTLVRELQRLANEHQGIAEATVTTAVSLSDNDANKLSEQLGRLFGKRVVVERKVDPSIIGGLIVRVGDTLINGSVAGRLAALRQQLV